MPHERTLPRVCPGVSVSARPSAARWRRLSGSNVSDRHTRAHPRTDTKPQMNTHRYAHIHRRKHDANHAHSHTRAPPDNNGPSRLAICYAITHMLRCRVAPGKRLGVAISSDDDVDYDNCATGEDHNDSGTKYSRDSRDSSDSRDSRVHGHVHPPILYDDVSVTSDVTTESEEGPPDTDHHVTDVTYTRGVPLGDPPVPVNSILAILKSSSPPCPLPPPTPIP